MTRDNLSLLFNNAAAVPPYAASPINASNTSSEAVANSNQLSDCNTNTTLKSPVQKDNMTSISKNRGQTKSDGEELLVGFAPSSAPPPRSSSTSSTTNTTSTNPHSQRPSVPVNYTKPGTESIEYLKRFGSMALKRASSSSQADNNVMRRQDELADESEQLARELQEKEEEEECERIKVEADSACKRVVGRYDALVKFTNSCPRGTYDEFVEFLLMGGGRSENDNEDDYNSLLFENFHDENSECRKLWNDNLTMGFAETSSTVEGRRFVPAVDSSTTSGEHWHYLSSEGSNSSSHRQRSFSEDESKPAYAKQRSLQSLRDRTLSEGERIKKQIAQVDKKKIKQGFGSAVNALSNVSSFALKPLRDLQLAEKLNAMNIDMEEEETRKEIEQYNRMQEDERDLEEMMKLKKESEEKCMKATKDHLLDFIKNNPNATYQQWIEDIHPENAHDGTLLAGMGKTIDHRFFVEESDHRHLWNENLFTFPDQTSSGGRDFVPARARQMNDNGEMVVATDFLSGSVVVGREEVAPHNERGKSEDALRNSDMIAFD